MHGRPQESKHRRSPLPEKSKIYIGPFSPSGGLFFFVGALFRLAPLTKNSVGFHGREQTICGYCNKGNTNTWCIKCNVRPCLQKPETAT